MRSGLRAAVALAAILLTETSCRSDSVTSASSPQELHLILTPAMESGTCTNTAGTNQTFDRLPVNVDVNGDFHDTWTETAPPQTTVVATGHVTKSSFLAKLACGNGSGPSGYLSATWTGTEYDGAYSFRGSTGSILVQPRFGSGIDVSGLYTGTVSGANTDGSGAFSGPVEFQLVQTGAAITGTWSTSAGNTPTGGTISGTINGSTFTFTMIETTVCPNQDITGSGTISNGGASISASFSFGPVACSPSPGSGTFVVNRGAPVAVVTVTPATATVAPGGTVQLAATTKDAAGNVLTGRVVSWTSSNPAAATVSAMGLVTGVATGSATITATSDGQSGSAQITVFSEVYAGLSSGSIAQTLIWAGCDSSYSQGTWLDEPISLLVNSSLSTPGAFTGRMVNRGGTDTWVYQPYRCIVHTSDSTPPDTVVHPGSTSTTSFAGYDFPITGTSDGSNIVFHYTVSDQRSFHGSLSVVGGVTNLRLVSDTAYTVSVAPPLTYHLLHVVENVGLSLQPPGATPPPVASVTVSPPTATESPGGTVQLTATPQDAVGNPLLGRVVTWSSTNPAVATVSGTGLVAGVAPGLTTISATSEGKSGTSVITVVQQTFGLSVTIVGSGTVTSSPTGINCTTGSGGTCAASFAAGTSVALSPTPAGAWAFSIAAWGGDCAGSGGTATLVMTQDHSCSVTFWPTLTVAIAGNGMVTSSPAGITCNTGTTGACSGVSFPLSTIVTLTATPAAGWGFTGWTGDCTGTGTCTVTMNAVHAVTANFTGSPARITVQAGNNQTAAAGTSVPIAPAVLVTDQNGNPTPNVSVTFAVTSGGGSVTGGNATTNTSGIATVGSWMLGPAPGTNTLTATASGSGIAGNPVAFTATGIGCTNCWSTKASLPVARAFLGAAAVNGTLYAVGGDNNTGVLATLEAYDPATDAWTSKASMSTPRFLPGVAAVNGTLYAVGGSGSTGQKLATLEAYDPITDKWTTKASMPTPRDGLGVTAVNGILYAVGGYDGNLVTGITAAVEAYDPTTDKWTTKASLPVARSVLGVGAVNGILYAVGGYAVGPDNAVTTVEAYDPLSDTWTTKPSMPTARNALGVSVINGILYAVGGGNNGVWIAAVEAFDPLSDTWTTKPSMPTARNVLGVAVINGILYAVGGNTPNGHFVATVEAFQP